jgi:hypothetical protein
MYKDTVFGIKWRDSIASDEVIGIVVVVALVIIVYFLYRYRITLKNRKREVRLQFLSKLKQRGLTGNQIRIVQLILARSRDTEYDSLFRSPALFETAIGDVLLGFHAGVTDGESIAEPCKDLIIAYEKLYHGAQVRKPVDKISDVEDGLLLYFYLQPSAPYMGRLMAKSDAGLQLKLFRSGTDLPPLEIGSTYSFFLWRSGDAEYVFEAPVLTAENDKITVAMPDELRRGKEVRRPFVDVMLPCTLEVAEEPKEDGNGNPETIFASILKINDNEAVLRHAERLDYRRDYTLAFTLEDFKISTTVKVISDMTVKVGNAHMQTCKFIEISEAAKSVLHSYIVARL